MGSRILWTAAAWIALAPAPALAGGTLTILGGGGGIVGPQITAISGDGEIAAGQDVFQVGFRYTDAGGFELLPGYPGSNGRMSVEDVSAGGVVVGQARTATGWDGFRHAESGIQSLGDLDPSGPTVAHAVSGDASIVVGGSAGAAFRWTAAGAIQPLSGAIGYFSAAHALSADGDVAAGFALELTGGGAMRWTQATGMQLLAPLPDHESTNAWGVSADGSAIVGSSYDDDTETGEAVRWTAGGALGLGRLPGTSIAIAVDVSGDGNVVVGNSSGEDELGNIIQLAFVWTPTAGMQTLQSYLASQGIDGSSLSMPLLTAISDDGRVLAGYDDDPSDLNAFIVRVQEPVEIPTLPLPAGAVLALALLAAARSRLHSRARPR